jgi:hypothetical protein
MISAVLDKIPFLSVLCNGLNLSGAGVRNLKRKSEYEFFKMKIVRNTS